MSCISPIKHWREQNGKTQEDLGSMLNVEAMTVSRWERGESLPRKVHMRVIKRKLGIEPAEIIKHAMGAVQ